MRWSRCFTLRQKPESHCHASCRLTRLTGGWLTVDRYQLRNREGKAYTCIGSIMWWIYPKMQNGYDSMTVMTVCEITTTETQTKPKNASHCHKPHCHNAYDSVATQCPEGKAYAMKAKPMRWRQSLCPERLYLRRPWMDASALNTPFRCLGTYEKELI